MFRPVHSMCCREARLDNTHLLAQPGWIRGGDIQTPAGLRLSFQRYARSTDGQVPRPLPSSLGALPVAWGHDGMFLLPLADDEACWIGLQANAAGLSLRVEPTAPAGAPLAPVECDVPAFGARVEGCMDAQGRVMSFARNIAGPQGPQGGASLACSVRRETATGHGCTFTLRLVDPATWALQSGRPAPAPFDVAHGYRGYLLPFAH